MKNNKKQMKSDYFQELERNIKHQNPKVKNGDKVGYEVEKGEYVFVLFVKLPFLTPQSRSLYP